MLVKILSKKDAKTFGGEVKSIYLCTRNRER